MNIAWINIFCPCNYIKGACTESVFTKSSEETCNEDCCIYTWWKIMILIIAQSSLYSQVYYE